ncbi:tyrosine-type recombinase/integrase [Sphaerisporangium sp. NPDC049003]|uniref:tyrosine-type recombinase/integrase n=1 Tax=Sphaerisporangium sp. NPDC049003 TaxID=3364517 RepID=UPI0037242DB8
MCAQIGRHIDVKRARVPKPGEPDTLTRTEQGRVERAAARRGVRDRAIVTVLLYIGARVEECAPLEAEDVTLAARTGYIRLHGKGGEVRTIPLPSLAASNSLPGSMSAAPTPARLWTGQRGRLPCTSVLEPPRTSPSSSRS